MATVKIPRMCRHRRSGRAYCKVNGKQVQLGPWGSPEAADAYAKLIARLPRGDAITLTGPRAGAGSTSISSISNLISIGQAISMFMERAQRIYSRSEVAGLRVLLEKHVRPHVQHVKLSDLRPRVLKE